MPLRTTFSTVVYGFPLPREVLRAAVNRFIDQLPETLDIGELDARETTGPHAATGERSLSIVYTPKGHWAGADGPSLRGEPSDRELLSRLYEILRLIRSGPTVDTLSAATRLGDLIKELENRATV